MATIFTKIIEGEIPAHKIAEDENYLAFLDIAPLQKGHTLVIPKKEVNKIFDLDTATLTGLMAFAQPIAKAIEKTFPCDRVGVAVIGLEVPHAHVHLIPINQMKDMSFEQPKMEISHEELAQIAMVIKENL
ncbi:MAG: HIT family protein [Saprospiraceae bacterium]